MRRLRPQQSLERNDERKRAAGVDNMRKSRTAEQLRRMLLSVSFFFSSRRRHTRFDCDWSSDVCSSDLLPARSRVSDPLRLAPPRDQEPLPAMDEDVDRGRIESPTPTAANLELIVVRETEIGRASCRERV